MSNDWTRLFLVLMSFMMDLGSLTPLFFFFVFRPNDFKAEEWMLSVMWGSMSEDERVENFVRDMLDDARSRCL